jgi:hypothetical protein
MLISEIMAETTGANILRAMNVAKNNQSIIGYTSADLNTSPW